MNKVQEAHLKYKKLISLESISEKKQRTAAERLEYRLKYYAPRHLKSMKGRIEAIMNVEQSDEANGLLIDIRDMIDEYFDNATSSADHPADNSPSAQSGVQS